MFLLNVSSAGLHRILAPIFNDRSSKSGWPTVLNFRKALTILVNVILERKTPDEIRHYFFRAENFVLKKPDRGLWPIASGNTPPAGWEIWWWLCFWFSPIEVRASSRRRWYCKGVELDSQVFRILVEIPIPKKTSYLRKTSKTHSTLSRDSSCLQKSIGNITRVHTQFEVSQVSFYSDSVIQSCEGTEHGNTESPALISVSDASRWNTPLTWYIIYRVGNKLTVPQRRTLEWR